MKTITINLYEYDELPPSSKEKVQDWFLTTTDRTALYSDWLLEDLKSIFPNSKLDIQFSFSNSPGDGINVYGTLNLFDFINAHPDHFTHHEARLLKTYLTHTDNTLSLNYNYRYNYSLAYRISFANNLISDLTFHKSFPNVDTALLYKLEDLVREWFVIFTETAEEDGYSFFFEPNEDEIRQHCDFNNCLFTIDGKFSGYI